MTRAIEAITSVVRSLVDDEPKPPLHVGEVMALWTALASFEEARYVYEAGLNTTQDPDLKHGYFCTNPRKGRIQNIQIPATSPN
ncbi:hypothetical protein [Lentibacillus sediminis]|uniref:hypothetical protein n=1 Tax=Lentibacillus sediminis TaxID=1940529 RepID=UPI000C1BC9A2|nr:hypothetical protein [Lentibacillus sediminis]